jgi:5'-3' exoribonuclease 2
MKMQFNVERIIDDFAFFCFFIGNDFLPSLTTLDISEGALDLLIDNYKYCLKNNLLDDYITENGRIHWDRAQPFIKLLGKEEREILVGRVD